MVIRAAKPIDVPDILSIWNPIIRDSTVTFTSRENTTADIKSMLKTKAQHGQPFLVWDQNGAKGFATYDNFRPGTGYAQCVEVSIHLHPNSRRMGAGTGLMTALEKHANSAGMHVLIAGISAENPVAHLFFTTCGFVETGRLPQTGRKFDRWHDLVFLQKIL